MVESSNHAKQKGQPGSAQRYSTEAVQVILSRALELKSQEDFSFSQLEEMAEELNIAPEELRAAAADWQQRRGRDRVQPPQSKEQKPSKAYYREPWFYYAIGSVAMIAIDVMTAGTVTWAIYPVMGWGLGLMFGGCDRAGTSSQRARMKAASPCWKKHHL